MLQYLCTLRQAQVSFKANVKKRWLIQLVARYEMYQHAIRIVQRIAFCVANDYR